MNKEEIIKGLESVKTECGMHLDESFAWICEPIDRAIELIDKKPCCNCIEFKRYAKEMGFEIEQEPVLDKVYADIQRLRGCSCSCSDGIIDDIEDIIDKYKK